MNFWPLNLLFGSHQPLQSGLVENRRHNRFPLKGYPFFHLIFRDRKLDILDISYGGLALAKSSNLSQEDELEAILHICGQECPIRLAPIHNRRGLTGCKFHHYDHRSLIFLQSFIEAFRQGYSALEIKPEHVEPKYANNNWRMFRGDGPIDLRFRSLEFGKISEFDVIYRNGEEYFQLHWSRDSNTTTLYKTIDSQGVSSRMTAVHDHNIEARGIYSLMGFAEKFPQTNFKPLIINELRSKLYQVA